MVKNLPANSEAGGVWSLSWEDPLVKELATHSSILVWRIPWTEETGGLQSMGSQRIGCDLAYTCIKEKFRGRNHSYSALSWIFLKLTHLSKSDHGWGEAYLTYLLLLGIMGWFWVMILNNVSEVPLHKAIVQHKSIRPLLTHKGQCFSMLTKSSIYELVLCTRNI